MGDIEDARSAWLQSRKTSIPEQLLKQVIRQANAGNAEGWKAYGFLRLYVNQLAERWVQRNAKKTPASERNKAYPELRHQAQCAFENAVKSYDESAPFAWLYRRELERAYGQMHGKETYLLGEHSEPGEPVSFGDEERPDKRERLRLLLERVRKSPELFPELAKHYGSLINWWVKTNHGLPAEELRQLALTGLWTAAKSTVSALGFRSYARAYMNGELCRYLRKNKLTPEARFYNAEDLPLEERVADPEFEEEKASRANRHVGVLAVIKGMNFHYDHRRYTNPKGSIEGLLHRTGLELVRQHFALDITSASLLYSALSSYVDRPILEELKGPEQKEALEKWMEKLSAIISGFNELSSEQQAGVALYGFSTRQCGRLRRPIRLKELKHAAPHLGVPPTVNTCLTRTCYDPWAGVHVKVGVCSALERRCLTVIANLLPSVATYTLHHLGRSKRGYVWEEDCVAAHDAVRSIEQGHPGIREGLRKNAVYLYGTVSMPYDPQGADIWYFRLCDASGKQKRAVLALPSKTAFDDFNEGVAILSRLTRDGAVGIQQVVSEGALETGQGNVPYAILASLPSIRVHDYSWTNGPPQNLEQEVRKLYEPFLKQGIAPPRPRLENIFVPSKHCPTHLNMVIGGCLWKKSENARKDCEKAFKQLDVPYYALVKDEPEDWNEDDGPQF
ncbi:hypothetical protein HY642_00060 [Candidatus Woesearchaeota archaeon]|nr:hypothetical protein [Candidatus Woesearchaeota archaeon]